MSIYMSMSATTAILTSCSCKYWKLMLMHELLQQQGRSSGCYTKATWLPGLEAFALDNHTVTHTVRTRPNGHNIRTIPPQLGRYGVAQHGKHTTLQASHNKPTKSPWQTTRMAALHSKFKHALITCTLTHAQTSDECTHETIWVQQHYSNVRKVCDQIYCTYIARASPTGVTGTPGLQLLRTPSPYTHSICFTWADENTNKGMTHHLQSINLKHQQSGRSMHIFAACCKQLEHSKNITSSIPYSLPAHTSLGIALTWLDSAGATTLTAQIL